MKKVCCIVALTAISFGSVFAHAAPLSVKTNMVQDTIKKIKKKPGKATKIKKKRSKTDTVAVPVGPVGP
jgi:hypothetical protein